MNMNISLDFNAFEGLQRAITLYQVDILIEIAIVIEQRIVEVLNEILGHVSPLGETSLFCLPKDC